MSTPSEFVPLKNSTWLTLLPPPDTEARRVNEAGAVNTVPLVGEVIVMTGAAGLESSAIEIRIVTNASRRFREFAVIQLRQRAMQVYRTETLSATASDSSASTETG